MRKDLINNDNDPAIRITLEPLSLNNWNKFVKLFGEKGACGSCWCMYYRLSASDFREGKYDDGNKQKMKDIVSKGIPTGVIGMIDGEPVAWCAFAPREDFVKLERSRVHKRIDNLSVWSIPCFFIDRRYRRMGVSVAMLKEIIKYAEKKKIKVIEAYPQIPTQEKYPDSFLWIGVYKSFEKAGFEIADRKSKNRPMVRYYLK